MAGFGYFRTNRTHTTSNEELSNQNTIVEMLLREKGFPQHLIDTCKKHNFTEDKKGKKRNSQV